MEARIKIENLGRKTEIRVYTVDRYGVGFYFDSEEGSEERAFSEAREHCALAGFDFDTLPVADLREEQSAAWEEHLRQVAIERGGALQARTTRERGDSLPGTTGTVPEATEPRQVVPVVTDPWGNPVEWAEDVVEEVINLTPHAICVETQAGRITLQPSGTVARVSSTSEDRGTFAEIPLSETVFGEVEGLPAPTEGVIFVVSGFVLDRVRDVRPDVFRPDTGPDAIRDEKGRIVAVRRLTR